MKNRNILITLIFLLFIPIQTTYAEAEEEIHSEEQVETPLLSFEAISDTHIQGTDKKHDTSKKMIRALDYLRENSPQTSLVINIGDFTERGYEDHMRGYYEILENYHNEFDFMTGIGNHEVMHLDSFAEMEERFLRWNQKYMTEEKNKVYYDKWVNGYHFIMLGTESKLHMESYISDEQLAWLDKKMAEGAQSNKPIFVGVHQPLRDTFINSNKWPIGVQDHKLKEILRKYPQTILFSGHLHDAEENLEILQKDYGIVVNVPSLRYNEPLTYKGPITRGEMGYKVDVYEDRVEINLRDYQNGEFFSNHSYTVDLDSSTRSKGKILEVDFDDETISDVSGNGQIGEVIGDVNFVEGNNEGRALHLINENYPETIEQFISFPELQLSESDFTVSFSYLDQEKEQWNGVVVTIVNEKNVMTLYSNGKKIKDVNLNNVKYNGLTTDLFKLIIANDTKLNDTAKNLIIDDLKVYQFKMGAAEIETINLPFSIDQWSNNIEISWEDTMPSNREVNHILVNGKKYDDFTAGDTYLNISRLNSNTTYDIKIVTHYGNNKTRLAAVYPFKVKTLQVDSTKDGLLKLYNLHKDKEKNNYSTKSWDVFIIAFRNAKEVLKNPTANKNDIKKATNELINAVENLTEAGRWIQDSTGWWYQNPGNHKEKYPKNKWERISGKWYHFDRRGYMQTGWLKLANRWYYLEKSGAMVAQSTKINGKSHEFTSSGIWLGNWEKNKSGWWFKNPNSTYPKKEWQKIAGKWYFFNKNGYMETSWIKDKNRWYYANPSGVMQTGWRKINSKWYYMTNSGVMQTNWTKVKNRWYYMNNSGVMQTGWRKINNKWYYLNNSGVMQTNWTKVKNEWYYMNNSGVMQTGWKKINNKWYFMNENGSMQIGWRKIKNKWYFMNDSGAMQIGWINIENKWYYLFDNGVMASNTKIDGFKINKNGVSNDYEENYDSGNFE